MADTTKPPGKIIPLEASEKLAKRETAKAVSAIRAELGRPGTPPAPFIELGLLARAALGVTGQSQICRYLLFLLVGAEDPTGFKGEGLLEMRMLDRGLADAFLKVLAWWRGPTLNDEPVYEVLKKIEDQFPPKKPNEYAAGDSRS